MILRVEQMPISEVNLENNISEILNISVDKKDEVEILPKESVYSIETNTNIDSDFELARKNIKNIIGRGDTALDNILDIAKVSEHPRTYEVAGQLIKTLIDANKDLLDIHKTIKNIKTEDDKENFPKNVTNAIFVGSTAELQKLIKEKRDAE